MLFGQGTSQGRNACAHHVHGVACGRQALQGQLDADRQTAQGLELGLVGFEFCMRGQLAMHQQKRNFFKLAHFGNVQNVIAAVVQIVAGLAHGA